MKRTSGGCFDPKGEFIYFLASSAESFTKHTDDVQQYPHVLIAVNELKTAGSRKHLETLFEQGRKVLLDSGIFNLAMSHARKHDVHMDVALSLHPSEIDGFTQLKDNYYELVTKYKDQLWGVIEMDQGGGKVKPETRAMIEKDTGVIPIPVWHPLLDGKDYYLNIVQEYDRVCVGNLVKASQSLRIEILLAVRKLSREHPHIWHHLLGVTPSDLSVSLDIHGSSDSSTWLSGTRWMTGWNARAHGKSIGHYPESMWYNAGDKSHMRAEGVLIANQFVVEAAVQDARAFQGAL